MITSDRFEIDACTAIFTNTPAPNGDPVIKVYPHDEAIGAGTARANEEAANDEGGG